jgi:tetratricopeptide (TPR) repeat protein
VKTAHQAIALVEALVKTQPADTFLRQELQVHYTELGDLLASPEMLNMGQPAEALTYYRKSVALCAALIAADPKNVQALREQSLNYQKMGVVMRELDPAESVRLLNKGREISTQAGSSGLGRRQGIDFWLSLAHSEWRAGDQVNARQHLHQVQQSLQDKTNLTPGTLPQTYYLGVNQLLQEMGETNAALEYLKLALPAVQKAVAAEPFELMNHAELADCYARLGKHFAQQAAQPGLSVAAQLAAWREAQSWYQKSLAVWREWPRRAASTVFNLSRAAAVTQALAQCDAALAQLALATRP